MATIITTVTQLQNMSVDLAADYELGNNIDASVTTGWNGGLGFLPVGDNATPFTGTLDGKGYTISDLFIARPTPEIANWRCGLFGKTSSTAEISNVTLADCDITAHKAVGALVGSNYGTVTNCHSTGSVTGANGGIGGLVGYNDDVATITQSSSTATVVGVNNTGGLIGQNYGTASESFATGDVTSTGNYAGGFAGSCESSCDVDQCYATGNVSGVNYVGGFAGYSDNSIDNCYATGSATASTDYAGGFVGSHATETITNCYSTGVPSAVGANEGGFCGDNSAGTITNCFWDTTTSGKATSDGGTGKVTADMKLISTFLAAGWAISRIWNMSPTCASGYPCLIVVNPCCPSSVSSGVDQTIVGNKVTLEAIRNVEMVYGGRFLISKTGSAVYESRYHRNV